MNNAFETTGEIRRLDYLGRLIIPKEIRKRLCFNEGDAFEILVGTNAVCFRKRLMLTDVTQLIGQLRYEIQSNYNAKPLSNEEQNNLQKTLELLKSAEEASSGIPATAKESQ